MVHEEFGVRVDVTIRTSHKMRVNRKIVVRGSTVTGRWQVIMVMCLIIPDHVPERGPGLAGVTVVEVLVTFIEYEIMSSPSS